MSRDSSQADSQSIDCAVSGCGRPAMQHRQYEGRRYCPDHYILSLRRDVIRAFNEWRKGEEPPKRFRYLVARLVDDEGWRQVNGMITGPRIRDRGYEFAKIETGCEFKIIRHLNAWRATRSIREIVQRWRIDIEQRRLLCLE